MLGISIYPDKSSYNELVEYLDLANKYGYKRVFTCLLSVDEDIDTIKKEYKSIINYATSLGMEVILDVSPAVFDKLNISYDDLSFFAELGATGIRLDEQFNGKVESDMTFNPYGLTIEVNMSQDVPYIDNILAYEPNFDKLTACHNFYPQKYTGLNLEYFVKASERFKEKGIRTAAFITSNTAKLGPWPLMEGMPTVDIHRFMKSTTQLKHFYMMNLIDDIIISNQFANEEELKSLSGIDRNIPTFNIKTSSDNNDIENKILFEEMHFNRGDINDYSIRSTQSRVKFKSEDFKPHDTHNILKKGMVIIGNDNFGQYKGELQIIKNDIEDEYLARNVVGIIDEEELFLIDLLRPWQKFQFKEEK